MIKLPFILAAMSILGVSIAEILPDKFSEFRTDALVTFIALSVLFFAYKLICVQQKAMIHTMISSIKEANQPMKDAIDPLVKLSDKIDKMPCLHKEALKEIFSQQLQQPKQKG